MWEYDAIQFVDHGMTDVTDAVGLDDFIPGNYLWYIEVRSAPEYQMSNSLMSNFTMISFIMNDITIDPLQTQ